MTPLLAPIPAPQASPTPELGKPLSDDESTSDFAALLGAFGEDSPTPQPEVKTAPVAGDATADEIELDVDAAVPDDIETSAKSNDAETPAIASETRSQLLSTPTQEQPQRNPLRGTVADLKHQPQALVSNDQPILSRPSQPSETKPQRPDETLQRADQNKPESPVSVLSGSGNKPDLRGPKVDPVTGAPQPKRNVGTSTADQPAVSAKATETDPIQVSKSQGQANGPVLTHTSAPTDANEMGLPSAPAKTPEQANVAAKDPATADHVQTQDRQSRSPGLLPGQADAPPLQEHAQRAKIGYSTAFPVSRHAGVLQGDARAKPEDSRTGKAAEVAPFQSKDLGRIPADAPKGQTMAQVLAAAGPREAVTAPMTSDASQDTHAVLKVVSRSAQPASLPSGTQTPLPATHPSGMAHVSDPKTTQQTVDTVAAALPAAQQEPKLQRDPRRADTPITQTTNAQYAPIAAPSKPPTLIQTKAEPLPIVEKSEGLIRFDASSPISDRPVPASPVSHVTTPPEQARHVAQQLVTAMPTTLPGTTEITLNPEELGKVRMTLTVLDGAMTLMINAERPETTDLMRRHIDQLMQTYRQMGFDTLNFSFAGSSQRQTSEVGQSADSLDEADKTSLETETPPPAPIRGDGRLDLRM